MLLLCCKTISYFDAAQTFRVNEVLRFLAAHCHGEGGCADLLEKGHLNELKGCHQRAEKQREKQRQFASAFRL